MELEIGEQGYINTNDYIVITIDSTAISAFPFIGDVAVITNIQVCYMSLQK